MKLFLFILILSLNVIQNICHSQVRIKESRFNIVIDASDKIGNFNEKVFYNLEFDNNEMKNVHLTKNLPDANSEYFDLEVKSKDVKILKYEIKEGSNFNNNNKIVNIEFEQEDKNFNQGVVNIDYNYKIKKFGGDEVGSVKNSFFLKDVLIGNTNEITYNKESNSENYNKESIQYTYPTKFSIDINNLPKTTKIKQVAGRYDDKPIDIKLNKKNISSRLIKTKDVDTNNISLNFELNTISELKNLHLDFDSESDLSLSLDPNGTSNKNLRLDTQSSLSPIQ